MYGLHVRRALTSYLYICSTNTTSTSQTSPASTQLSMATTLSSASPNVSTIATGRTTRAKHNSRNRAMTTASTGKFHSTVSTTFASMPPLASSFPSPMRACSITTTSPTHLTRYLPKYPRRLRTSHMRRLSLTSLLRRPSWRLGRSDIHSVSS
jgi:hypothetical protein